MAVGDGQKLHRQTGRRIAIGDQERKALTDSDLFLGLSEFANSRMQLAEDDLWLHNCSGARPYIDYQAMMRSAVNQGIKPKKVPYVWRPEYRPTPAKLRLTTKEQELVLRLSERPWIALGPCLKAKAPPNKDWGFDRWESVAKKLARDYDVRQILAPGDRPMHHVVRKLTPRTFREAATMIFGASMYLGHEGGLHHAAAAGDRPGVVVFGGFVNPKCTGYDTHVNLTGFDEKAKDFDKNFCGTRRHVCLHCAEAMARIAPELVESEARRVMNLTQNRLQATG